MAKKKGKRTRKSKLKLTINTAEGLIFLKPGAKDAPADWVDEYGITNPKQRIFLHAFVIAGTLKAAAAACKVTRKSHWVWCNNDPAYKRAFEDAVEQRNDALEAEAIERATKGVCEDVWYQGKVVGKRFVKDTTLLIFLMKGAMPQKYRENIHADGNLTLNLAELIVASKKAPEVAKP